MNGGVTIGSGLDMLWLWLGKRAPLSSNQREQIGRDLHHGMHLPAPACLAPLRRVIVALSRRPASDIDSGVMLSRALRRMAELHHGTEALQYRARAVARLQDQIRKQGPQASFDLLMAYGDAWGPLPDEGAASDLTLRQLHRQLGAHRQAYAAAQTEPQRMTALLALIRHAVTLARHPLCEDAASHALIARAQLDEYEAAAAFDGEAANQAAALRALLPRPLDLAQPLQR